MAPQFRWMIMKIDCLTTKRCLLREIEVADAEQIVLWRSNPEVYKYFKYPIKIDREHHLKWFKESYLTNESRIDFVALLKDTDEKIGLFGISRIDDERAELSYLLDDDYQGRGFASEVISEFESFFSKKWGIKVFLAEIHKDNAKSILFIEKMGYVKLDSRGEFSVYGKRI